MTNLSHKDVNFLEEEFQKHEGMSERERQVMKKLKEVVDKQRDEIRAKDRELGLKNEDVEALQQQQNRLMKINHDLRHRITVVEAQGKALIEQKVELEAYLQTKEQEMGALRTELGKLREKVQGEPSQNGEDIQVEEPNKEEYISESEKMAMDLKDPNRPRFTLQELRDVLHERNELKSKVFLLQEELLYYKRYAAAFHLYGVTWGQAGLSSARLAAVRQTFQLWSEPWVLFSIAWLRFVTLSMCRDANLLSLHSCVCTHVRRCDRKTYPMRQRCRISCSPRSI
uniref:Rab interacting lysosomal protein like 1 n=1 Tax=Varanus komodoensis TaxID=61221 RepID=A0A8D2LBI9_VARKO